MIHLILSFHNLHLKGKLLQMHIQIRSDAKKLCPRLFSANSSLRVFSKSWQYNLNAQRRFALAQAVSKTGPLSTSCKIETSRTETIQIIPKITVNIICIHVKHYITLLTILVGIAGNAHKNVISVYAVGENRPFRLMRGDLVRRLIFTFCYDFDQFTTIPWLN